LHKRLDKAAYELTFAVHFDKIVINDNLELKCLEVTGLVEGFLKSE
jgi:guanylate kinase